MLRIVPGETGAPFLLNGQLTIGGINQPNNQLWVRSGGPAAEVAPGQRVPSFPEGGIHFPWRDQSIPGPQSATCTEVTPTNAVGVGTLDNNTTVQLPNTLSLSQGDLLLLEDSANVVELIAVVKGKRRIQKVGLILSCHSRIKASRIRLQQLACISWLW